MPRTQGETLSGKKITLVDAVSGHRTILIMGFSKAAGDPCSEWMRALRKDPDLGSVVIYEAAMIASAPSFVRGMIKSGMRKGLTPAEQENFLTLVTDEKPWQDYFHLSSEKDPYVVLLDSNTRVLWQGHGAVKDRLRELKSALH